MKQQHHPEGTKRFFKGANTDVDISMLGESNNGEYYDAQNMRPNDMDGSRGDMVKIGGEEVEFSANEGGIYKCVCSFVILGQQVEVFTSNVAGQYPFIRIDGTTYLKSQNFPLAYGVDLQYDIDENCPGGEFCLSDNVNPPMVFNVQDMIDELPNLTYFDPNFEVEAYQVSPEVVPDHPVFKELVFVGGDNGLPVGQYSYSFRYVTADGDRTNWSLPTPLIFVPQNNGGPSNIYPGAHVNGDTAGEATPNTIKIAFRVNNKYNFESIEIRRTNYNSGVYFGNVPYSQIVGRIGIERDEFSIREFVDSPTAFTPESITEEEEFNSITKIDAAKAVRYFNNRLYLMNVKYQLRDVDSLVFNTNEGKEMFPIVKRLTKTGYNDAWNHAYRKPFMRGEKYGYAAVFFDGSNGASHAVPIPNFENFQMPNRRDKASSASIANPYDNNGSRVYSEDGMVHAADVFQETPGGAPVRQPGGRNTGGYTFEVFDLVAHSNNPEFDPEQKTELAGVKNISTAGSVSKPRVNSNTFFGGESPLMPDQPSIADPDPEDVGYQPFRPVSQNDNEYNGHKFNQVVATNDGSNDVHGFYPQGYAPNYYSLGMGLAGITNIPDWAESFAIVRTKPAGRIICQGIGMYMFTRTGKFEYNAKELWKMIFHSPDIVAGLVDPEDLRKRIQNGTLRLQFVSPLGFFSEPFSFNNDYDIANVTTGDILTSTDGGIDMMSYARILYDNPKAFSSGGTIKVNPIDLINNINYSSNGANDTVGQNPAGTTWNGYTRFGSWRNTFPANSAFDSNTYTQPAGGIGNQLFNVESFELGLPSLVDPDGLKSAISAMGRGLNTNEYFEIQLETVGTTGGTPVPSGKGIYSKGNTGGPRDYEDADVKDYHEPWYIINIIDEGAEVNTSDNTSFFYTGTSVKLNSEIGQSDGEFPLSFPLVDERWEDCIPAFNDYQNTIKGAPERYLHIVNPDGTEETWLNVTWDDQATRDTLADQIAAMTASVDGMYTHDGDERNPVVKFDVTAGTVSVDFVPQNGAQIFVRYNSDAPVKVFGGDVNIGESIFSPLDIEHYGNSQPAHDRFQMENGWPFSKYQMNPRYYIMNRIAAANKVQNGTNLTLRYWRQMSVMYTIESRVNTNLMFSDTYPYQAFPSINYVMRPYRWKYDKDGTVKRIDNIHPEYFDDYPDEDKHWGYGGIRFIPRYNLDYSHVENSNFWFKKPEFGYNDESRFCSRVAWSLRRPVNSVDSPGSRTFMSLNIKDISDDNGEIKYAFDEHSRNGTNLYAFTESGICLLLTDQNILRGNPGDQISLYTDGTPGVQGEQWLSKEIGMNDEFWRSAAEYDNILYFVNKRSVYRFTQGSWEDIALKGNYHSKIYRSYLDGFLPGTQDFISGGFDIKHKEYVVIVSQTRIDADTGLDVTTTEAFVFNGLTEGFNGTYEYLYDRVYSKENELFGVKNQITYKLNEGTTLNGSPVEGYVVQSFAPTNKGMEFIRIRINSDNKPTRIEFFDDTSDLSSPIAVIDSGSGSLYLKDYHGFEQYIPRETAGDRNRVQGRTLVFKIINNLAESFIVEDATIQYKILK